MIRDTFGRPLRDLRISVTDRCNFRCPYCMPIEIFGENYTFSPRAEMLSFEEITRLTRLFVRAGVEKVRLTGGEPLIRQDLPRLVEMLAGVEGVRDLTLTTNGWFLAHYAPLLKAAGLHRVTVSLDSLDDEVAGRMNGRGYGTGRVLEGIEAAAAQGLTPVKVNAVVKRGENDHTVPDMVRRFRGTGVIPRFVEYMDVGNRNGWRLEHVVPSRELVERIDALWPLEPLEANYAGEVAERYRFRDGGGEIGFISSISQPFCGDCSRARLSTDGKVVTCLFAGDGASLRDPMRAGASDEELFARLAAIWQGRSDRYSELRTAETPAATPSRKFEMYRIGG